jgi:hypothetical protein
MELERGLAMKKENVKTEKQQLTAKANTKEAYKKPALTKHDSLRDITGQSVSGGVIGPGVG